MAHCDKTKRAKLKANEVRKSYGLPAIYTSMDAPGDVDGVICDEPGAFAHRNISLYNMMEIRLSTHDCRCRHRVMTMA